MIDSSLKTRDFYVGIASQSQEKRQFLAKIDKNMIFYLSLIRVINTSLG